MDYQDGFKALGLSEEMLETVGAKGFEMPSPIQKLTIPVLLGGNNDVIAQAQTGTGKTAAFAIPLIERLKHSKTGVKALVLVPTRELALQVTEEMLSFNRHKKLQIAAIYGGASISEQLRRLEKGIDIVVGTPGRILDHIHRGTLVLSGIEYLVLDEADEMLNMGFIEDIEEIMSKMNDSKRVMLFSATMPDRIVALSKKYMRDTEILKVESQQVTTDLTNQIYFEVRESDKFDALTRIIDVEPEFYGIVFGRTKIGVDEIVNRLLERGYAAEGLHGDVSQAQREKILRKFKKKQANILVATDVAARGIDINNLSHVINYSLPQDSESYVHRIGRTGRAGNQGTAITFISNSELRQFGFMKRAIKAEIKKESLPSAQDVVTMKRAKIMDDLQQIVESENYSECVDMAREMLEIHSPEVALSALLRLAFKNELSESHYSEIRSFTVDRRGKARLFISIGRLDGYDARKMVNLLKRECNLSDNKIDDVKVMDSYSFATVPFAEAEVVVRRLNALRKGNRPLAEVAKGPHDDDRSTPGDFRENFGGGKKPARGQKGTKAGAFKSAVPVDQATATGMHNNGDFDSSESPEIFGESETKPAARRTVSRAAKPDDTKRSKADTGNEPASGKTPTYDRDDNGDWFSIFERRFGDEGKPAPKKQKSKASSTESRKGDIKRGGKDTFSAKSGKTAVDKKRGRGAESGAGGRKESRRTMKEKRNRR